MIMNASENENEKETKKDKTGKTHFARRADKASVVQALPQPGGADILRARKQLKLK
jgi:hypothetical protein